MIATIPVYSAEAVTASPDGRHAYVTNNTGNSVAVLDTERNTVTATIPVGQNPFQVAVSRDGRHAYVPNTSAASVSVIDTVSNAVTATIPVGPNL